MPRNVIVSTADVVVISWVDSSAVTLPPGASLLLRADLNTFFVCSALLLDWAAGLPTDLFSNAEVAYANAFLLKYSGNAPPPPIINPDSFLGGRDFRMFNRLQATYSHTGDVISRFSAVKRSAEVGPTPDPCGLVPRSLSQGDSNPSNGVHGVTFSKSGAYQLAEGRIGTAGQLVSFTINKRTVPWVWTVIRFDASGVLAPLEHATCSDSDDFNSCFPTHSVYVDGILTGTFSQNHVGFILRDFNYQKYPTQIR